MGTIHGMGAVLALVVIVYTGHLTFPLRQVADKILPHMGTLAFWETPGRCTKLFGLASEL
ncbi:hypothetical protein QUA30_27460 [Microcoleus sp. Pol14C2]|uniref:hypothetical protein n=1 Tax=unclassified Microcoleus TaxID=2642155 RepID=UPI002FD25ECD